VINAKEVRDIKAFVLVVCLADIGPLHIMFQNIIPPTVSYKSESINLAVRLIFAFFWITQEAFAYFLKTLSW